ncbi:LysE family translocator [Rhizobium tumorigenes]|uniref:LysE family translocator n=1 Tax=Rhizobium tumorigenes TaxID=2041385 RepID=UPI00241C7336|nr:LysE family translocator [Rhizobium tumorigenes]WFS04287.1 LysE family translocator [Rhizobium tumorigenes]
MIALSTYLTYVAVVFGLFLIPGPAVFLVLARSISGGRRVGIATGLGVAFGDLVHTLMATLGLSAILMTSALAFEIVKYAGVAYLVYLGIRSMLEKQASLELTRASKITSYQAFRQAIVAEILNPKTALFFLAFLPQFITSEHGAVVSQFAILGLTFAVMSALYTSILAVAAGSVSGWISGHRQIGKWQGKIIGSIYLTLGARLAVQHR